MEVENLKTSDIPELVELFHKAYAANEALGIHFKAATITAQELEKIRRALPIFVTKREQKIVSTVSIRLPWSSNPSPFALPHLGWLATDPSQSGQGLAKELVKRVTDDFVIKELRAPALTLGTAAEHPWLVRAYQKMGFSYLGERQLFSDHKTIYLIRIFDGQALRLVKDNELLKRLKEIGYEL
ncbi:GNAT family N-acetyltransferase [Streptococcus dentapri]|uniref:GNAT family N-acetyltransferase n=1 Tax=Streptococcus dentapri TaxID=573564 RepID=A0ABV8D2T0_9STRE